MAKNAAAAVLADTVPSGLPSTQHPNPDLKKPAGARESQTGVGDWVGCVVFLFDNGPLKIITYCSFPARKSDVRAMEKIHKHRENHGKHISDPRPREHRRYSGKCPSNALLCVSLY